MPGVTRPLSVCAAEATHHASWRSGWHTRWHARDSGLLAANATGQRYFERKPKGAGDLVIEAGESVIFRYRILVHQGDAEGAGIAERYQAFCEE